jgi:hypothetical protein
MPPPSWRPGRNSTVPLVMTPSAVRTAHPVFWPRSRASSAPGGGLGSWPASAGRRTGTMVSWVLSLSSVATDT